MLFATDKDDNVRVTVRWPNDALPAKSVHTIASMLNHISSGHWKPPMIVSVKKQGVENQQTDIAGQILLEWGNITRIMVEDTTCISPRQVFARHHEQG